ncbi:type IV secretion system protein [Mitsuokella sp. oral taxon 131]|uniref:type IV secretion system protein n=1 Tax=Mitsuokella sp. oral taxon 131 TaxID=1321780 RepID=UPI0035104DE6
MDLEREQGGGTSGGAPPQDAHGKHKDWTVAMDFAKPIRDATEMLTAVITKALGLLKSYVAWVFFLLVTIDLALGAMKKSMLGTDEDREGLFRWMVRRVLFYAMCLVLLFGWGDFVGNLSLHGFPALGALAGGDTYAQTAEAAVSDPTKVVQKGMNLVAPLINEAMSAHGLLDMLFKGPILIICLVAGLVLFFLFCLIGYQIAMAYIEFYLTILFSFTSFTFAGLKQVRQYASNGLNSVFAVSLNLMFFCLFAVMLQTTMENMVVDSFISTHTVQAGSREELPKGMIGDKGAGATVDISGKPHADIAYLVHDILKSQYGKELRVDWIYAQLVHESANFTSYISRNYHNHAGMGYDGHGDYTRYGSDEEFARDYALTLSRYDVDGLFEAQTLEEYAAALKHGGYFGAPLAEYIHGLNAALNGGAFSSQSVLNLILLLKFILVVLMYMFFADRVSKFVLTQFGTSGFRLSREG